MIKNSTLSGSMRKFLRDKSSKKGAFILFFSLFGLTSQAQMNVSVDNPMNATPSLNAEYSSLAEALNALNVVTSMSGSITLTLTGSEVAPAKGLTIGSASLNAAVSATKTITLKASGPGEAGLLAAADGTATPDGAIPDGILKLVGADYITIDGIVFNDGNTDTTAHMMEYGLAMFKAVSGAASPNGTIDGCQNNTVQNCTFNMQKNFRTGTPSMYGGSMGIFAANVSPTAATTDLFSFNYASSSCNSNNKFYSNTINGANIGIYMVGTNPNDVTTGLDINNDIGGNSIATGNSILDFGGTTQGSACGIRTDQQKGVNISYNTINNSGVNHTSTLKGIYIMGSNTASSSITVKFNTLTLKSGASVGSLFGIDNASGSNGATNTIEITDNKIQNCSFPNVANYGNFHGINNTGTAANVNISNNYFTGNSYGKIGGSIDAGTFIGINNTASKTAQNYIVSGNTISNNSILSPAGTFYGIQVGNQTITCDGNTIEGNSVSNTDATTWGVTMNLINNSATSAVTETYTNNTISGNLIGGTSTAAAIYMGIAGIVTSSNTNSICSIHHNAISGSSIFTANGTIKGIVVRDMKDANVYNNKIYNFGGGGAGNSIDAISLGKSGGTTNVYNNIIGSLQLPNAIGSVLAGINANNTTTGGALNIYYNTINLDAKTTGTNFGSKCIFIGTGPTATLRNNLLVNNSDSKGTLKSNILERAEADVTKYNTASNNNLFFSNSGANVYFDGTNAKTTLSEFQALVGEAASVSVRPSFASLTGSDPKFLHINVGTATAINGGAAVVTSPNIDKDYDGDSRDVLASDIGADEFTPAPINMTLKATICSAGTVDLTAADITAGSDSGLTYTYWRDDQATLIYTTPAAATAGTYYIKGTNATGGFVIKSVTVVGSANPSLIITNPSVCAPAMVDLTAAGITEGSDSGLTYTYWTDQTATTVVAPGAVTNGTYYIKGTNSAGCASIMPVEVTVKQVVTPTFTQVAAICTGATLSALPTTSGSITGTWTPALNNTATTDYTFTPTAGQCANTATMTITVNQKATPTFTPVAAICSGTTLSALPTTSGNITGTWAPALNNTATTTYTFTPAADQCANTADMTITVNQKATPTFTPVAAICSGTTLSALPTVSGSITGTWAPALNNTATTDYTFTPTAGQCANTATMTITVNQKATPTFTPVAAICSGTTLSALPTTSGSITGTWSPALNNTATTDYTFTPTAGQCANTATMTITVNQKATPTFTQVAAICSGATLSALPTTSGSVTGTWAPALNNTATTDYTFTPTAGQCANTATMTITVNQKATPAFTQVAAICSGSTLSALPTTSGSITGTWAPALNNTATTAYTFTPTTGQCANTATMTITVNQKATPTFTPVAAICSGGTLSALPTTSGSITGTWAPALNNTATTAYTFTPTAGQCANTATMTIDVTPKANPSFTQVAAICSGSTLSALPTTSGSITGTWAPALNNTATTTYTFTPTAGQCANTATMTITVNQKATPTFTQVAAICSGSALSALPTTSGSVTGTWAPALNNTATTTYTFTPTAGQCANTAAMTITVNQKATPTFTQVAAICSGSTLSALPTTSGSITGTWSPALNNSATTTYTFTPSTGQCANAAEMTITVNAVVAAPTGDAQQTLDKGKTVNDIVIQKNTNGTVTWYASEAHALAGTPALLGSAELAAGTYYAMQSIDGCRSISPLAVTVTIKDESVLGVDKLEMTGLTYYPNPVREELNISYSNEINSIEVFNLLGQQIQTIRPNAVNAKVNMSGLPKGTYLLQVSSQGKSRMIKVAKE